MTSRKGGPACAATGDYEVGYCKPPVQTRFAPKKSGNPNGRPRRKSTLADRLESLLAKQVEVTADGVPKKMAVEEVALRALLKKATAGDLKAFELIVRLRSSPLVQAPVHAPPITDEEDDALITAALMRLTDVGSSS